MLCRFAIVEYVIKKLHGRSFRFLGTVEWHINTCCIIVIARNLKLARLHGIEI